MSEPARILTVCTGNICRSPFLERALQAELDRSWGPGEVVVRSAGTGALDGHPMEDQARALLEARGYSAAGFAARSVRRDDVAEADLVLTATRAHRSHVVRLHPPATRRVVPFRELAHLLAGLAPRDLHVVGESARDHIQRVVGLAQAERGVRPVLADEDADVVDPYRRPPEVFEQMTQQITDALPAVVAALGRG